MVNDLEAQEVEFSRQLDNCIKQAKQNGLGEDMILERMAWKLYQLMG